MSAFRWILAALGVLAGLAGIGALYQLISEARDKSKLPPPGKLVDVGGHRLHINSIAIEISRAGIRLAMLAVDVPLHGQSMSGNA